MGAASFILAADGYSPLDGSGGWEVRGKVILSNNYTQGGDTLPVTQIGLGYVTKTSFDIGSAGTPGSAAIVVRASVNATQTVMTLQAFWTGLAGNTPFQEVAAGTNLQSYNVGARFEGN